MDVETRALRVLASLRREVTLLATGEVRPILREATDQYLAYTKTSRGDLVEREIEATELIYLLTDIYFSLLSIRDLISRSDWGARAEEYERRD